MSSISPITSLKSTELESMGDSLSLQEIAEFLITNPMKARAHYNSILNKENHPLSIQFEALMGRAKTFFIQFTPDSLIDSRSDFEGALQLLSPPSELLQQAERKAEIYKYLALICLEERKYDEARDCYVEGWKTCKSDSKLALDYIKFLKDHCQEPESALQLCSEALDTVPDCSDLLYTRAKIQFSCQNWLEAYNDCQTFLQKGRFSKFQQIEMLDLAAESCLKTLAYKTACQYLKLASEKDLDLSRKLHRLKKILSTELVRAPLSVFTGSMIQFKLRERKAISKSSEKGLEFFKDLPSLYAGRPNDQFWILIGRAIASIQMPSPEHLALARTDLEQALLIVAEKRGKTSKHVEEALIFHWLARLSIQEQKIDEAFQHFKTSWSLNSADPQLLEDYVDFLIGRNPDEAHFICQQAELDNPNNLRITFYRAKIYFAQQQWLNARLACARFLEKAQENILPALDLATEICIQQKDYLKTYQYMNVAYHRDRSLESLNRFKKVSEMKLTLKQKVPPDMNYSPLSIDPLLSVGIESGLIPSKKQQALDILNYVVNWTKENGDPLLFKALIHRSRVLTKEGTEEELIAARADYEQASFLVSQNPNKDPEKVADLHLCHALILSAEKNSKEAFMAFQSSWKTLKSWDLLILFGIFLCKEKKLNTAQELLNEFKDLGNLSETNFLWTQSIFYFEAQEWNQALETCHQILKTSSQNSAHRVHRHALKIALELKDYEQAKEQAIQAYRLDRSMSYVESMEELLQIHRLWITDQHLKTLYQEVEIRIPYFSLLLEIYTKELAEHPKHHVEILTLRGQLQTKPEKAIQDFEEVLRIMDANPGVFTKEKRNEIIEKIIQRKK